MRRKTIAKGVLDCEHEDEQEEDQKHDIDDRKLQSELSCHVLQKRRKHVYPIKECAEENSPHAADILKLKTRALEFDSAGVERSVGKPACGRLGEGARSPGLPGVTGEGRCLQLCSEAELVAMVLCMQKEMETLREQIRCLTGSYRLAGDSGPKTASLRFGGRSRALEALVERTQLWSDGADRTPSPRMPGVPVGGHDLAPVVLNGQWVEQGGPAPNSPPELRKHPQRNGHPGFQEFISAELLDRCNTGTTAQKLTNELLRGVYQRERLASHSISGAVYSKRGRPKPALPTEEVQAILRAVQHYFPGKTDAEIKGYIRQKLQNEAKRLRKRPHPLAKTEEGVASEGADAVTHRGGASPRQPAQTSGSGRAAAATRLADASRFDSSARRCADRPGETLQT